MAQTSRVSALVGALLLGASCLLPTGARAADPNVLWKIVHTKCVPGKERSGNPRPCAIVDVRNGVEKGYALLKDIVGPAQFLLIPTARISGIESPAILAPNAPNYFSEAWRRRSLFERRLYRAVPREDISLAINSAAGRTQNQFHIHIDCVRPDVRDSLRRQQAKIGPRWRPIATKLAGHRYIGMRVVGNSFGANPFKLLASRVPGARARMGSYTLAVVGEKFAHRRNGFLVLARRADSAGGASGEELQDHACAIASLTRRGAKARSARAHVDTSTAGTRSL
jgi:CDP-diacylglycerol pyrophosphatase